jgi:hypothetical protein
MLFLDSLQSFNAAQRELPFRHQLAGSCGGLPDTSELINEPINAPAMERDTQSSCSGDGLGHSTTTGRRTGRDTLGWGCSGCLLPSGQH